MGGIHESINLNQLADSLSRAGWQTKPEKSWEEWSHKDGRTLIFPNDQEMTSLRLINFSSTFQDSIKRELKLKYGEPQKMGSSLRWYAPHGSKTLEILLTEVPFPRLTYELQK